MEIMEIFIFIIAGLTAVSLLLAIRSIIELSNTLDEEYKPNIKDNQDEREDK